MEVDYLMLADYAEATNGKIYIQGGGWDRLTVNSLFPYSRTCGIALGIRVAWEETNFRHQLRLAVLNEDAQMEVAVVEGEFEVGRAPGLTPGLSQVVPVAFNQPLSFAQPGSYSVHLSLKGEEVRAIGFTVVAGPLSRLAGTR